MGLLDGMLGGSTRLDYVVRDQNRMQVQLEALTELLISRKLITAEQLREAMATAEQHNPAVNPRRPD